ncbi:hypothetical protein [Haloprofundus halobius]|uniref:hypothetical protein n=1 Tax=Haloprofundus halobius TaxID=2876194 RepID=UPI001CCCFF6D|nr:hypothetical protein [Haloprofundus halobius]
MSPPSLFHLHFNTPNVDDAAERLGQLGVSLHRRFGSVGGESVSLTPEKPAPDRFRPKLQVHRHGAVDITLAPGRRPHFDHLGLFVRSTEDVCERAESRGWSVRPNERRTFVMTPWGFRVEIHDSSSDIVAALGSASEARLENVIVCLSDADAVSSAFGDVFGAVSDLRFESGEGPWVDSFGVVGRQSAFSVDVATLLRGSGTPA